MAIESADYEQTRQRLMKDPDVRSMALGIAHAVIYGVATKNNLVHEDGSPRHEFMMRCNDQYRRMGGNQTNPLHIGAIAEVIVRLLGWEK